MGGPCLSAARACTLMKMGAGVDEQAAKCDRRIEVGTCVGNRWDGCGICCLPLCVDIRIKMDEEPCDLWQRIIIQ